MITITHLDRYQMPGGDEGYSFHILIGKVLLYGSSNLSCTDLTIREESGELLELSDIIVQKIKDSVWDIVSTEKIAYNARLII